MASGNYIADRLCFCKDCQGAQIFTVSSCPHQVLSIRIIIAPTETKDFLVHTASKKPQAPKRSPRQMHISGYFSAAFGSDSGEWAGDKAVPPRAWGHSHNPQRNHILNAQISFAKPEKIKQTLTEIIKIAAYFRRVVTLLAINVADNNNTL